MSKRTKTHQELIAAQDAKMPDAMRGVMSPASRRKSLEVVAVPKDHLRKLVSLAQDHLLQSLLQQANDGRPGAQKSFDDAARVVDAVIDLLDPGY